MAKRLILGTFAFLALIGPSVSSAAPISARAYNERVNFHARYEDGSIFDALTTISTNFIENKFDQGMYNAGVQSYRRLDDAIQCASGVTSKCLPVKE